MEALEAVMFLTVAGERLAEWLLKPLTEWIPEVISMSAKKQAYFEMLICAIPGFAFSVLARLDAFCALGITFAPPIAGVIITAIFVGGGSNLVHIFVDRVQTGTRSLDQTIKYWDAEDNQE